MKPCPFCGEPEFRFEYRIDHGFGIHHGWEVDFGCANDECLAHSIVMFFDYDDCDPLDVSIAKLKDELEQWWSKRK